MTTARMSQYSPAKNLPERPIRVGLQLPIFNRFTIRQKIGIGYALVIGIAFVGTVSGFIVEAYYKNQLKEPFTSAYQTSQLLTRLNLNLVELEADQKQLTGAITQPQQAEPIISTMRSNIFEINRQLQQFTIPPEITNAEVQADYQALTKLTQSYSENLKTYSQELEKIVQPLESNPANPNAISTAQTALQALQTTSTTQQLFQLSRESLPLIVRYQDRADQGIKVEQNIQNLANQILFFSLLVATFLALVLGVYTSWVIAYPIEMMVQVANQVGDESDFDLQVPIKTNDEIGELTEALNHLIRRVAEYTEALEKAKITAESANRSKSVFLANMSHELRTPLNAIIGYSEMLHDESADLGYNDFLPDLERIQTAGTHLRDMISDILDISKIEAGHVTLYLEDFDVNQELIQDVITTTKPLAEKNNNVLKADIRTELGRMYADLPKVRQVLLNLLSNACKFTDNGVITLSIARVKHQPKNSRSDGQKATDKHPGSSQYLVFKVRDTGIGMTTEQAEQIFKAFTQADPSTTKRFGGTGLGLAISQRLCEILGGGISVDSEPGKGSVFTVWFPVHVKGDLR
ncbi:MAG: ATP-binding protein [Microcoleaceae cyanobacterium]